MPSLIGLASIPSGPGIGPMFSIISGNQQQAAATDQANSLSKESTFAYEQSLLEAAQNDYNVTKTKASQDAQFASSGVTLAGSPLGILTETQSLGNQVSNAIKLRGQLQSDLYSEQGLQMLRQGSAAAFAGQAGALNDTYQYKLQKAQATNQAWAGALSFGLSAAGGLAGSAFGGFGGGSDPYNFGGGGGGVPGGV